MAWSRNRTRTSLLYPLLDSFPDIYTTHPTSAERGSTRKEVATLAGLSTTSAITTRIRDLREVVGKLVSLEDREALTNSLGDIAEAYEDGWEGGSDEDDD